jgi:O-succinylhomoserine sulfhydrylase
MTENTPLTFDPATLRPRTRMVHGGTQRSGFDETCEALFMTSGYVYGSAEEAEAAFATDGLRFVYSRFRNPTVAMFEDRLAAYEGAARCFSTASGMAAVFAAVMCQVKAGDRIVAPHALFGSCLYTVKNLAVCELAHAAGARVIVDNVFATPVLQRPLELGADIVVYSATKHIDGQGRCLGGAILCDDKFAELIGPFLRHTGPALSPFNAWLLLKGLETLDLRVAAHSAAAAQIAGYLEDHSDIARVLYPGLPSHPQHALAQKQMAGGGPLIAFEVAGGKAEAFRLMNALRIIKISNNLGDSKSLITHPATSTHQRLTDEERAHVGIGPASIRLSVGLEDPTDLIADLDRALAAV